MSRPQITVERRSSGLLVLSAIVGGHLETRVYCGYSERVARSLYRASVLRERVR